MNDALIECSCRCPVSAEMHTVGIGDRAIALIDFFSGGHGNNQSFSLRKKVCAELCIRISLELSTIASEEGYIH